MAPSITNCCVSTVFRYKANVPNSTATCIESPKFKLSDVNWRIKLCKTQTAERTALGIYLISSLDENMEEWSCEAKAMFKLLPKNDQTDRSIVKFLVKQKFGHANSSQGFDEFIDWKEFLEHYVSGNEAEFEIAVSANPLNRNVSPNLDQTYSKLRLRVDDVSELEDEQCYSPEVIVRGIKWRFLVKKMDDYLAVFLSSDSLDLHKNWSYKVDATFRLLSFDENVGEKSLVISHRFNYREFDWGFNHFLSWSEFTDKRKRYVVQDTANFELEFAVDEPKPLWEIDEYQMKTGNSSLHCSVCLELFSTGQIYSTRCGHLFCQPCFKNSIEGNEVCPMCKTPSKIAELHPIYFT